MQTLAKQDRLSRVPADHESEEDRARREGGHGRDQEVRGAHLFGAQDSVDEDLDAVLLEERDEARRMLPPRDGNLQGQMLRFSQATRAKPDSKRPQS